MSVIKIETLQLCKDEYGSKQSKKEEINFEDYGDIEINGDPVFPIEVIKMIALFCDAATLTKLSELSHEYNALFTHLETNCSFWEKACAKFIPPEQIHDIGYKLFPNYVHLKNISQAFWRDIYISWNRWNCVKDWNFTTKRAVLTFNKANCIETSGPFVLIGQSAGCLLLDIENKKFMEFPCAEVTHIELFNMNLPTLYESFLNSPGPRHDKIDLSLAYGAHRYIDPYRNTLSPPTRETVGTRVRMVQSRSYVQVGDVNFGSDIHVESQPNSNKICSIGKRVITFTAPGDKDFTPIRIDIKWDRVMSMCIWHNRVIIFAQRNGLYMWVDGKDKLFQSTGTFPAPTCAFIYGKILFIGNKHGSIYLYKFDLVEDLLKLNLSEYTTVLRQEINNAVVAINVIEYGARAKPIIVCVLSNQAILFTSD